MKKYIPLQYPVTERAFTLIELMVVVILITVLASTALVSYSSRAEKSRSSEAKNILAQIRDAEMSYYIQYDIFSADAAALNLDAPASCNANFYFRYDISLNNAGASFITRARRCGSLGKSPNGNSNDWVIFNSNTNSFSSSSAYQ